MSSVYFFDDKQKFVTSRKADDLTECFQEKEISANEDDLIKNTLTVSTEYDSELEKCSFMAVKEQDDSFSLYRILNSSDPDNRTYLLGSDFALDELNSYIVKEIRPNREPISSVARRLLEGTEWELGIVSSGLGTVSDSFYYISVKESLKMLQTFGCEIEFRCDLNSDGINRKWINIYKKIGKNTGKRFTLGDKALTVVKKIDRSQIFTSLIGRGKGEEVGETEQGEATYGRRTEFENVVWSKANGDPLDKPKGQIFLEDKELTKLYGIPQKNGSMRKRESVVIFEDETEPKVILKKTYEQLKILSRPLIEFKTTVLDGDSIGNTVSIHDFDKGYHYEARVFKTKFDLITNRLECNLGDNITTSVSKMNAQQINSIQQINEDKTSYYDATAITKWQSDVIRGASEEGGNVFLMSPSDLGSGKSRAPVMTVWMNGPSLDESDRFLVANNSGIGFIEGKFDLSKFKQAWTIDGILTLGEGMLQLGSDRLGKFLENTVNGLEFFNTESSIGTIGTSSKPFPGIYNDDFDKKSLAIEINDGEFFKIQTSKNTTKTTGIYIPNPDKPLEPGFGTDFVISHMAEKGTLHIVGERCSMYLSDGKVEVRTKSGFFVDGVQISQNGGGTGGGNGSGNLGSREEYARNMITDNFNADYEKVYSSYLKFPRIRAWGLANRKSFDELNEIIRGQGVSPVFFWAYESGEGYNASLSFLNHFYIQHGLSAQQECRRTAQWIKETSLQNGSLAWYDAMYPRYTSPPDKQAKGNAYMADTKPGMIARVMLQGTAAATWAMFDPAALSGSVNGVQDYADPFEHQMSAISSWQRPQTYIKPMKNYVVTSEFGWREGPFGGGTEFHNAIDLANGGGSTVYASGGGVVVTAGPNYFDWYGNYVVIRHPDGLYTGYAHLSSVSVTVGQQVNQGQRIGLEGATGPVTGPHLHFQFMKSYQNGWPIGGDSDFINPREKVNL